MILNTRYIIGFIVLEFLIFTGCGQHGETDRQIRPNILFIMSDDHAQKAISAYDKSLMHTPNIDRIAREGAIFNNSFVANSICAPSRAVMLTGKHSHINGKLDNADTFDGSQWTFPKELQKAGYYTALVGKWHLKSIPAGFDYWNILDNQGDYYNPDMIENGDTTRHTGYVTDVITNIAMETIDNREASKPFCMLYHHKAPHRSWMPDSTDFYLFENVDFPVPDNFFDQYEGRQAAAEADMKIQDMFLTWDMKLFPGQFDHESELGGSGNSEFDTEMVLEMAKQWLDRMTPEQRKAWDAYYEPRNTAFAELKPGSNEQALWMYQRYMHDYLKCVASVDRNIGKMLDFLEKEELLENTIIVYTSDQGFYLGEHGWYDKRFMYEESFRTPLIMRYPKEIEAGTVINNLVQNIDYAPTFLDLAGLEIPKEVQGVSLRPIWNDDKVVWRKSLYYHYYEYPHGWHMVNKHDGIRTERYKLIDFYEMGSMEFYDLKTDTAEMNNLYGEKDYQMIIDSVKQELEKIRGYYKVTK